MVSNMVRTLDGFAIAQAARASGAKEKKLDMEKLKKYVDEHQDIEDVYAGLVEDWEWTGDKIYDKESGWIDKSMAYTSSLWATPIAYIYGNKEYNGISEFTDTVIDEDTD